jgi:thiol-disulfide isomerase/thioredoxin
MNSWFARASASLLLGCSLGLAQNSASDQVLAPYKWKSQKRDTVQDRLVLYYFGASECPPCNAPENVELIKQLKARLPAAHPDLLVKTVLIHLDHDFERAQEFAGKYGAWDEISVGSDWFNELTQHYRAKSKANAIPHVMVFRDSDGFDPAPVRGHYLKQRILVGDYLVGPELGKWLEHGTPLWYLETLVGDADVNPPRFEGRWKSTKARNPDQVAEVLELTVVPASSQFRIELQEAGAASSIRCSEGTLSHPRKLSFTAQEDDTTATAECVLSLDGRRMRLAFKPLGWSEQTIILDRVAE